jgi:hypothetical protein
MTLSSESQYSSWVSLVKGVHMMPECYIAPYLTVRSNTDQVGDNENEPLQNISVLSIAQPVSLPTHKDQAQAPTRHIRLPVLEDELQRNQI